MATRKGQTGGKKNPRYRRVIRDSIQGLTKPAIQRLMQRAGTMRFSGLIYEETRGILKINLENVLRTSSIVMDYMNVKTLKATHVATALSLMGVSSIVPGGNYKTASLTVKKRDAKIRNLQKDTEDLIFPRKPFERLVREIFQDYQDNTSIGSDAFDLLQIHIETHMVTIYTNANMIVENQGRKTISPKDLQLVRHISGERN